MSMKNKPNYTLVWKECGENSPFARRFYVPNYVGYLPFFVYGTDFELLENGKNIELREEHLLKGIFFGLHEYEKDKKPWHNEHGKQTWLYLLDVLGNCFGFENPEKMVLDIAYDVRDKNGSNASFIILQVGHELIPDSSKIMSDLICDTWAFVASENSKEIRDIELQRIVNLIYRIRMNDVSPNAREIIAYFGLSALVILCFQDKVSEYLNAFIYPYVNNQQLKEKIKTMLENPASAKVESFEQ